MQRPDVMAAIEAHRKMRRWCEEINNINITAILFLFQSLALKIGSVCFYVATKPSQPSLYMTSLWHTKGFVNDEKEKIRLSQKTNTKECFYK